MADEDKDENKEIKDRSQTLVGEWKHEDNVLTITQDGDQLKVVTESGRASLLLEKDGDEYVARVKGKDLYAVNLDGEDAVEMKKGGQTYQLQRVAKAKSLLGEWSHNGKSLSMEDRSHGLVMVSAGKELKLLRLELNKWEASQEAGAVYHIEHSEGDDKVAVTRIGGGDSIDFHRVRKEEKRRSPPRDRDADRDRKRDASRPRDSSRGREDDRKSKEKHEEALLEFVKANNLSQRVEDALKSLSKTDREYIISFELKGDIRDPDAVIMSRIRKLQMGGRGGGGGGGGGGGYGGKGGGRYNDRRPAGSRSRSRGRGKGGRRNSRSDSRDSRDLSYSYSCSEYSDESSYSYVSVKKRKRKSAPTKRSKKDSAPKVKREKDKDKKGGKKDRGKKKR